MDNTGCTTICATESTYVKATISQSMLTDARVVSRLVRRMNALPKNVFIPSGHWEPGNSTYQASVATLLGLQPDEIQSVAVLYVPTFTTGIASRNSPVPATTASTQANSPEHPTSAFVPTTDISDRVALSFTHPSSISTSSILSDVTSSSKTDVKTPKSPPDALAAAESSHSTLDSSPKRLVIEEHPDSQPDLDYESEVPLQFLLALQQHFHPALILPSTTQFHLYPEIWSPQHPLQTTSLKYRSNNHSPHLKRQPSVLHVQNLNL